MANCSAAPESARPLESLEPLKKWMKAAQGGLASGCVLSEARLKMYQEVGGLLRAPESRA